MNKTPIYKHLAKYYDLIYSWKNYKQEAKKVMRLIKQYKKSPGKNLLEIGCGTGKHIKYFKDLFSVTAMDVSKEMLDIARKNTTDVELCSRINCGMLLLSQINLFNKEN